MTARSPTIIGLNLDWRAAASAGRRSRELPLVALAEVTFPLSSTKTSTATCPAARICLAIGGYAGFGRETARPFKTPALTGRVVGTADGVGFGVALGVGATLGRVSAGVGVAELELFELELAFVFAFGVALGVGVGVALGVGVLKPALVLRLRFVFLFKFAFVSTLKLKFADELPPVRLAFKFILIGLKLALIILFSFESSELSRLRNK